MFVYVGTPEKAPHAIVAHRKIFSASWKIVQADYILEETGNRFIT